jgi:hypothetical protein
MLSELPEDLIERIPQPAQVRERLAEALRQVRLLRQLLRLAERADDERGSQPEERHAH